MSNIQKGSTKTQNLVGRLLAAEDLTIRSWDGPTAAFEPKTRTVYIPQLQATDNIYNLFVAHEVAHALYTPDFFDHDKNKIKDEYDDIPKEYLNVIEDIRIEHLIQRKFPGLKYSMKKGYRDFSDMDFFGIEKFRAMGMDIGSLPLIDKINLFWKMAENAPAEIQWSDDETDIRNEAVAVRTWDDVIRVCRLIMVYDEQQSMTDQHQSVPSGQPQSGSGSEDGSSQHGQSGTGDQKSEQGEGQGGNSSDSNGDSGQSGDQSANGEGENSDGSSGANGSSKSDDSNGDSSGGSSGAQANESGDQGDGLGSGQKGEDGPTDGNSKGKAFGREGDNSAPTTGVSYTDQEFRRNEHKIISDKKHTHLTLDDKRVFELVTDHATFIKKQWISSYYNNATTEKEWLAFLRDQKSFINALGQEFEMRKSAHQFSLKRENKTGSLDTNNLHQYKISEDIFSRKTIFPDGKSHGLVLLVDFSGSMSDSIGGVLYQTILLAQFCKQKRIPVTVYSFTNDYYGNRTSSKYDPSITNIESFRELRLVEIYKSGKTKSSQKTAEVALFSLYKGMSSEGGIDIGLGGTPLFSAIVAMRFIVPKMQEIWNVEKMHFGILTDGEGESSFAINDNKMNKSLTQGSTYGAHVEVDSNYTIHYGRNKRIEINGGEYTDGNSYGDGWTPLYKMFDGIANTIGFYLMDSRHARGVIEAGLMYNDSHPSNRQLGHMRDELHTRLCKEGFVSVGEPYRGHDNFIFMLNKTYKNARVDLSESANPEQTMRDHMLAKKSQRGLALTLGRIFG